jgi:hypothetical protein
MRILLQFSRNCIIVSLWGVADSFANELHLQNLVQMLRTIRNRGRAEPAIDSSFTGCGCPQPNGILRAHEGQTGKPGCRDGLNIQVRTRKKERQFHV